MKKSEEAEAVEAYAGDTEPQFDHGPQFASQRTGEWQQSAPQGGYYVQQAPVHFAPPPGYDPAQGYVVYAQAAPGYPPQRAAPYPHQMPQYGPVQGPPAPYPQATQPQPPYPYAQGAVPNYAPRTAEAPVREHGFDTATDWASRDIAERFAPGAVPLPKSEPAEPGSKAKKPGSSLLGGLGFRRTAEPQYKKPTINMLKRPAAAKLVPTSPSRCCAAPRACLKKCSPISRQRRSARDQARPGRHAVRAGACARHEIVCASSPSPRTLPAR